MWRKHETHKAETKAVKQALTAAGINAVVCHGHGTAWGWLEINVGQRIGEHWKNEEPGGYCVSNCPTCLEARALSEKANHIVHEVTGRTGEHNGDILILSQSHWNMKTNQSDPILQPYEVTAILGF